LSEPIILKVMKRDGVRPADIRALIQQAYRRLLIGPLGPDDVTILALTIPTVQHPPG
jgi:hypothetical protein